METKLKVDIIDQRKVEQVKRTPASFTYNPQGLIISDVDMQNAMAKLAGMDGVGWEGAEMLRDSFLAYMYRGREAQYEADPDNKADEYLRKMFDAMESAQWKMPDGSVVPLLDAERDMSRHAIYTADLVAGTMFERILRLISEDDLKDDSSKGDQKSDQQGDGSQGDQPQQKQDGQPDSKGKGEPQGVGESKPQSEHGDKPNESSGHGDQGSPDSGNDAVKAKMAEGGTEKPQVSKVLKEKIQQAAEEVRHDLATTRTESGQTLAQDMNEGMAKSYENSPESPYLSAGRLTLNAQKVADKMGRVKDVLMAGMADKVFYSSGWPIEIEYGNNVRNAIKTQFVHIDEPTEPYLMKQIYDRQLMQRKLKGRSRAGKGPIILCIDCSGSMRSKGDHTLQEWAFALAGAIGWAAARRQRDVGYVYYSSTIPDIIHIPARYRQSTGRLERAIASVVHNRVIGTGVAHPLSAIPEMQRRGIKRSSGADWKPQENGGGTRYEESFEACQSLLELNKNWRNADILHLSDGGDAGTGAQGIAAKLQADGARIYGIRIVKASGEGIHGMSYFDHSVEAVVNADSNAEDLLYAIGRGL